MIRWGDPLINRPLKYSLALRAACFGAIQVNAAAAQSGGKFALEKCSGTPAQPWRFGSSNSRSRFLAYNRCIFVQAGYCQLDPRRPRMELSITTAGKDDIELLRQLNSLADELDAAGLDAERSKTTVQGAKDGGLTLGIALAGLALSAIGTAIQVLDHWAKKHPDVSVTLKTQQADINISGLDKQGVRALVNGLKDDLPTGALLAEVTRR